MITLTTILVLMTVTLIYASSVRALSVDDLIRINVTVTGCNNNGTCEASLGETTATCPNDCEDDDTSTTTTTGPSPTSLVIKNLSVTPDETTAEMTFETNFAASIVISYGTSLSTLDQTITIDGDPSVKSYSATLTDLEPGTLYFFRIDAETVSSPTKTATRSDTFETLIPIFTAVSPTNFNADYQESQNGIVLTWDNPPPDEFDIVRVLKSDTFYPSDPTDGEIIYEGRADQFVDTNVEAGVTYYYTLFARNDAGQFSSGLIDSDRVPIVEDPDPVDPDPTDPDPDEEPDPFDKLPDVTDPDPALKDLEFRIIQSGRVQTFLDGDLVALEGDESFVITVDYDDLPEVLKTIGVTLIHPTRPDKVFSFLLKVDDAKTQYQANIAPLYDSGEYEMHIHIIDHQNNRLSRYANALVVGALPTPTLPRLPQRTAPVGFAVGVSAGLLNILFATTRLRSLHDLYMFVVRAVGLLMGLLGFRRRREPWGVVYDSVTKQPLDPAYVTVKRDGIAIDEGITDLDGRYGFLLEEGRYELLAQKSHYKFPSDKLSGRSNDGVYGSLYFGGPVFSQAGQVINQNIPMDPVGFDWNEFVKSKDERLRSKRKKERIWRTVLDVMVIIGFGFTLIATVITPSTLNIVLLSSYIALFIIGHFWTIKHKAALVVNSQTDDPYSFAIITAYMAGNDTEVKKVVADEFGRFYLLLVPGDYYITVDAKGVDGLYSRVYQSGVMHLKDGHMSQNVEIMPAT